MKAGEAVSIGMLKHAVWECGEEVEEEWGRVNGRVGKLGRASDQIERECAEDRGRTGWRLWGLSVAALATTGALACVLVGGATPGTAAVGALGGVCATEGASLVGMWLARTFRRRSAAHLAAVDALSEAEKALGERRRREDPPMRRIRTMIDGVMTEVPLVPGWVNEHEFEGAVVVPPKRAREDGDRRRRSPGMGTSA